MSQLIPFSQSKGERLTWDEQKTTRLFQRYQNEGDSQAKEEIYLYYVNLVEFYTMRYTEKGAERDDLFQEGSIGLLTAIERFDLSLGFRFSTYSSSVIRGHIRQYFRNNMWPCHVTRECKEMSLRLHRLDQKLGHLPNALEAESMADIPLQKYDDAIAATQSWSTVLFSDTENRFYTSFPSASFLFCADSEMEKMDDHLILQQAIEEHLTPIEATIIYLYYFADLPQREIASQLDTYQMRVSRALHQGLTKLEEALNHERMVS